MDRSSSATVSLYNLDTLHTVDYAVPNQEISRDSDVSNTTGICKCFVLLWHNLHQFFPMNRHGHDQKGIGSTTDAIVRWPGVYHQAAM